MITTLRSTVSSEEPIQNAAFATTHWTAVVQAARPDSPEGARALAELCRTYWYPLYTYVRRRGYDVETAQDLTQDFFARLLQKNYVGVADRKRGKFRWFLLTAFKCFLVNEWDRSQARKRGGGTITFSLDQTGAEDRYRLEPTDSLTADQLYDRRWALELLSRARCRLREEYSRGDKADRLPHLEPFVASGASLPDYALSATTLGMSEPALRQEVHRFKKRLGELIRNEVAQTIIQPSEIEEELRYLLDVVCRSGGVE